MQTIIYDGDTITHNGRDYKITFEPDYDTGAPWGEYDGTGIIREGRARYSGDGYEKSPGERILHSDNGYAWFYDWQATMQKAKREGWGCDVEQLAKRLGRTPTRGEVIQEAVGRDFKFCRGYLRGDWYYVVICVEDVETGECEYLGGVESLNQVYLSECAFELIGNMGHAHQRAHDGKFSAVTAMGV